MTFKKYSVKNGKKYGPYIYHNQRVGEKVVTHYVGKGKSNPLKEKKYLLPWLVFGILLLIIAVFAFFFNAISPTGLVIMEIKPQYELGEPILGLINFNFKSGELIPADSKITVSLGSQRKELALSDLIEGNLIEGDYYAEQNPIEGSGFGYGAIGSKIVYPTLDFELSIQSEEVVEETSGETTENNQETETTETSPTDEGSNTETTETSNDLPAAPETPSNPTTETTTTESSTSDSSSSETSSSDSSSSSDSGSSDSGSSGSSSGDSSSGGDGGGMTGAVIGEDEYTINGQVSGEEDYDYNLEEGQTAVLVPGSVKYNGTTLEDSQVNIKIKNGKVIVTTDYSFVEEGFGRDFLGDFALSVPVDLKLFEIVAEEGALNAVLVYDETSLSRAKIDIGIKPNATLEEIEVASTIEVIQDIPSLRLSSSGRTIINLEEYFVNASNYELITTNITGVLDGHNMTLTSDPYFRGSRKAVIIAYNPSGYSVQSNEFNILVSSSNISITTEQGQVKVGEKVKWIKTVKLEEPEAVTIEIPAQSESIVVTKVEETISDSNSGEGLLTGNVVIDIELHKESPLLSWLKVVFNAMTGNVVESVLSESTEVVLDDGATEYQVEYYTEAPTKKEKRTSFGKQVTVSASDDLNYTNVLAFTEIQEIYSVGEENKIRVYWEEGARYLEVDAYDLNENGKLDYIEWVVPHLSDQNFRIILFDDVTAPTISFVSPTSADGSTTMTLKANISVSDASDSWYTFLKLDSSLIGWWRWENNGADESGNGLNATLFGNAHYGETGYGVKWGNGLLLNGSDDSAVISYNSVFGSEIQELSISVWFLQTQTTHCARLVDKLWTDNVNFDYRIVVDCGAGSRNIYWETKGDTSVATAENVFDPGEWNHIVATFNSTTKEVYLNGVSVGSETGDFGNLTIHETNLVIGDNPYLNEDLDGVVDDLLIFHRVLSRAEILSLYNATANSYYRNFASLTQENHTIKGYAVDAYGNKNQTETRTIMVSPDITAPAVSFVSPTPGDSESVYSLPVNLSSSDSNSHYALLNLDSSLLGWWRGENNTNDDSTYSNNGTLGSGVGYSINSGYGCVYGDCFHFTDSTSVDLGIQEFSDSTTEVSLGAWVKLSSISGTPWIIGDEYSRGLYVHSSGAPYLIIYPNSGVVVAGATTVMSQDTWYHVVGTYNATGYAVYVDGVLEASGDSLGDVRASSSNTMHIGGNFLGLIDEVFILNRTLGPEEVLSLYNATTNPYYRNFASLADGNHTIKGYAVDSSGNKNETELRTVTYTGPETNCVDFVDNDNNGFIDCLDSNCNGIDICEFGTELTCDDGHDNDGDGGADCGDSDCNGQLGYFGETCELGTELSCSDGFDNDVDGLTDSADTDCDVTYPLISYGTGTASDVSTSGNTWVYVNVSVTETNEANITFRLYNSSGSVNSTTYLTAVRTINWTSLPNGAYTYNATVCDASNNCNTTSTRTITLDTTYPLISYGTGTLSDSVISGNAWVYVNVSVTETNEANITFKLYNSTAQVNSTTYLTAVRTINWTSLPNGAYTYNATVCDASNNCNTTSTRTITLDIAYPQIAYAIGTENNNEILLNPASLYVNSSITPSSGGLANVTYSLYNTTSLVNRTVYTSEIESITWSLSVAGNYSYEINTTGNNNLANSSGIRNIKLLRSCLEIGTCTEDANCTINQECYLFSAKCSNSICDFYNFTMGANGRLYTGYDTGTGGAMSLNINISGNNSFVSGSRIIFNGKNGSTISPGTAGTNAGTINWTTSGLFNTRYGIFGAVGGKSTLASTNGGNGGTLQINYKGLVGNFSDGENYDMVLCGEEYCPDNSPVLTGGFNSLDAITGTLGTVVYSKSLVCNSRRDADITNDGLVSQNDKQIIENNYNLLSTENGFNSYWDISCDGKLNVREIARIGFEYNTRTS